jgi:hypothetical protein
VLHHFVTYEAGAARCHVYAPTLPMMPRIATLCVEVLDAT